ncbi:tRNA guanosine(34) transglycosylase Tgt [Patescibacteria group bacterium]|nr:MAG: tRNA guanosine(34) transglycosylase Tgt [Patescibacteria group bacterium]
MKFTIEKKLSGKLGRAGKIETPHGTINTPAFIVVGTKATVKALTPDQVKDLGAQAVLANTYHLYLEPGEKIVKAGGGLHKIMNWSGPTFTDSGGFQAFSLGAAFGTTISKLSKPQSNGFEEREKMSESVRSEGMPPLAKITEDGVMFKSYRDGGEHFFSPEKSIEIQNSIGADIIFAFDECTSPTADKQYQKEAMERTHRWAARSLARHKELQIESLKSPNAKPIALFGVVQGGRFEDLRKESAHTIGSMDFDGFGIGGSFDKQDIGTAVSWVNEELPEGKPRHLLGIGEPEDFFLAIENGCDTFDCVAPTRQARNGTLYTKAGKIHIDNTKYREFFAPIEADCTCYTCRNYTLAYVAYLARTKELLAHTLTSIHNLHFIVHLVESIRQSILSDTFEEFKKSFLEGYTKVD